MQQFAPDTHPQTLQQFQTHTHPLMQKPKKEADLLSRTLTEKAENGKKMEVKMAKSGKISVCRLEPK